MKVCALAFNAFLPDVRIYKEALSLAEAGHEVTVLALARPDMPRLEYMGPVKVIRVPLKPPAAEPRPARWPRLRRTLGLVFFPITILWRCGVECLTLWTAGYQAIACGLRASPRVARGAMRRGYRGLRFVAYRLPRRAAGFIWRRVKRLLRWTLRTWREAWHGVAAACRPFLAPLPGTLASAADAVVEFGYRYELVRYLAPRAFWVWRRVIWPFRKLLAVVRRMRRLALRQVRRARARVVQLVTRVRRRVARARKILAARLKKKRRLPFKNWRKRLARRVTGWTRSVNRRWFLTKHAVRRRFWLTRNAVNRSVKQRVNSWRATIRRLPCMSFLRQFEFAVAVRPYLEEIQPDYIHSHDLLTLYAGLDGARRTGARLLYDAHEMEWDSARIHRLKLTRLLWRVQEAALIGAAQRVVTVSPRIAELYRQRYRIAPPLVLPNLPFLGPGEDTADQPQVDLRAAVPGGADKRLVLYIGNVSARRGVEECLQALALLPAEYALVTLGGATADFAATLNSMACQLGVADRFHMLPPVPYRQVAQTAAAADVGVIAVQLEGASYRYCMPNKLFELMHAGLPLVVGRLPDVERVVQEQRIGMACDQTSPASLAKTIEHLCHHRHVYRPTGERLRRIQLGFCWEAFSPGLVRCYQSLAGRRPTPSPRPIWWRYLRPRVWRVALGRDRYRITGDGHTGLTPLAEWSHDAPPRPVEPCRAA